MAGDDTEGVKKLESMGLISEHSYGLIEAREVHDKHGKLVELVKLRNPWGRHEWKGAWSE